MQRLQTKDPRVCREKGPPRLKPTGQEGSGKKKAEYSILDSETPRSHFSMICVTTLSVLTIPVEFSILKYGFMDAMYADIRSRRQ